MHINNAKYKYSSSITGAGLFEFVMVLLLVSVVTGGVAKLINNYSRNIRSTLAAKQALKYSSSFLRLIRDKYPDYLEQVQTSEVVTIDYATLKSSGNYISPGTLDTNIYHQTPCVALEYDSTRDVLTGFMYYTQKPDTKDFETAQMTRYSAMVIGPAAGLYDNSDTKHSIYGTGASWGLDTTNPIFDTSNCNNGGTIPNNSLVLNLEYLDDANALGVTNRYESPVYLLRVTDPQASTIPMGDPQNSNTITTDIALTSNVQNKLTDTNDNNMDFAGIHFNIESGSEAFMTTGANLGAYLDYGDNYSGGYDRSQTLGIVNGGFKADAVTLYGYSLLLSPCSQYQEGNTIIDDGSLIRDTLTQENLVCTYNPYACSTDQNNILEYCYLPSISVDRVYDPEGGAFDIATNPATRSYAYMYIDTQVSSRYEQPPKPNGNGFGCWWGDNPDTYLEYTDPLQVNNITVYRGIHMYSVFHEKNRVAPWCHPLDQARDGTIKSVNYTIDSPTLIAN